MARYADELAQELRTDLWPAELQIEKENGIRLITFKDWLKGARNDREVGEDDGSDPGSLPGSQLPQADSDEVGGSPHSAAFDGWG